MTEPDKVIIYLTDIKNFSYVFSVEHSCGDRNSDLDEFANYIGHNWLYLKDMDQMTLSKNELFLMKREILEANNFLIECDYALDEAQYFDLIGIWVEEVAVRYPDNNLIKSYNNRIMSTTYEQEGDGIDS